MISQVNVAQNINSQTKSKHWNLADDERGDATISQVMTGGKGGVSGIAQQIITLKIFIGFHRKLVVKLVTWLKPILLLYITLLTAIIWLYNFTIGILVK